MSELLQTILGNDLVEMKDEEITTTSRKIAEVFGKEHYNVLADIEKLKKDVSEIDDLKFEGVENINNCMEKSNALKFQGVE